MTHFTSNTEIAGVANKEPSRYRLDTVRVVPYGDKVLLAATDAKCAAIVEDEGQADEACFIPAAMLEKSESRLPIEAVKFDGYWTAKGNDESCQRYSDDDCKGRWPKLSLALPAVSDDTIYLTIDTAILARLAAAISSDRTTITLLVPRPNEHFQIDSAIAAIGRNGIGAIMGLVSGTAASAARVNSEKRERYERLRHAFIAATEGGEEIPDLLAMGM